MIRTFPTEREEKRKALLDAVEEARGVLTAGADQAEEMTTLPKPRWMLYMSQGFYPSSSQPCWGALKLTR